MQPLGSSPSGSFTLASCVRVLWLYDANIITHVHICTFSRLLCLLACCVAVGCNGRGVPGAPADPPAAVRLRVPGLSVYAGCIEMVVRYRLMPSCQTVRQGVPVIHLWGRLKHPIGHGPSHNFWALAGEGRPHLDCCNALPITGTVMHRLATPLQALLAVSACGRPPARSARGTPHGRVACTHGAQASRPYYHNRTTAVPHVLLLCAKPSANPCLPAPCPGPRRRARIQDHRPPRPTRSRQAEAGYGTTSCISLWVDCCCLLGG